MGTEQNTARIDGKTMRIRDGQTILDAARKAGIYIPTLCYLEHLHPHGGCRLCIVEVKNRKGYPAACTTPIEPGMEIQTHTEKLQALRREILELTLSEHPYTCLVCKDRKDCTEFMHTTRKATTITGCNFCTSNGDCELQDLADYLELKDVRYPISYRGIPSNGDNPFYDLDYNLCILCGRCIRICNEGRHSNVLAFVQRGNTTIVGTAFGESQLRAGCEFCGACVDVCPTGSISEKMGKWAGHPDNSTGTSCLLCPVGCRINLNTRGNRIVNVGPPPGERTDPPQVCIQAKFLLPDINHHPSRITVPLIRKGDKWVETGWEDAVQFAAGNLQKFKGRGFGTIGSAQDTLEDNYSLQKFSRMVMKSNNIDLSGSHADRRMAMWNTALALPGTDPDEILRADALLVIGTDASVTHPMVEYRIRQAFHEGKPVVYATDRPTRTSRFATHEIRYKTGKPYGFLYGLAGALAGGEADKGTDLKEALPLIREAGRLVIIAGDGMLQQDAERMSLQALKNIRILKNLTGRCSILMLTFEGSTPAARLAGIHPDLLPGLHHLSEAGSIEKWNAAWGTALRKTRGLTYGEMVSRSAEKGLKAMLIAGDIPVFPGLKKLEFCIQINMFRTGLSGHADVILPVTSFLEQEGHTLGLSGKPVAVKKVVDGPGQVKPVSGILGLLAAEMDGTGFGNGKAREVWKEIRETGFLSKPRMPEEYGKTPTLRPPDKKSGKRPARKPGTVKHQYRYRGNDLAGLIPDLAVILKETKGMSTP